MGVEEEEMVVWEVLLTDDVTSSSFSFSILPLLSTSPPPPLSLSFLCRMPGHLTTWTLVHPWLSQTLYYKLLGAIAASEERKMVATVGDGYLDYTSLQVREGERERGIE